MSFIQLAQQRVGSTNSSRRSSSWLNHFQLAIKVNELLKKGQLREFLSEKAKSHLSKETTGKPTKAAPVSPPCQDRVIHVISGANCLVKRIRVNNGSSDNIIFQAAYKDLGMEESALTRRITPLIGFIGCWGKIFHEEITPASGFQVPTSRFRVPAPRSGSLPPGLGPTSSVRLPGRHVYNSTYWLRPRSPAHQQGPPCSLKHLNTSCSMQHIDRSTICFGHVPVEHMKSTNYRATCSQGYVPIRPCAH
ncbi:hypothetical protein F2Q68_00004746 [Brassica cretica]|uniref:Uncharacterized protein n=1 Tax=Brassica cretica TaxID=69181 RepID=A0A8S9JPC4_BRACR|nr:hypothetical protein F2Q68_00004746 [Brassica cretica]